MKLDVLVISMLLLLTTGLSNASTSLSPYAGEEARNVKSLSSEDVEALLQGRGWGFAKAAELNGVPGPLHLLEMGGKIHLTESQRSAIEEIYNAMKGRAMELGEELVKLEVDLNKSFAEGIVNEQSLRQQLQQIGKVRAELRFVHLAAHLQTPAILNPHQILLYNQLRGYGGDPCESVPEGHDEQMWKKHNGCS